MEEKGGGGYFESLFECGSRLYECGSRLCESNVKRVEIVANYESGLYGAIVKGETVADCGNGLFGDSVKRVETVADCGSGLFGDSVKRVETVADCGSGLYGAVVKGRLLQTVGMDCMETVSKGWRLLLTVGVDCMEP